MQVKKFEAPTIQEALKVIKRELGPEAIILSTKNIKSGFGLMSKASVEVTAAIAEKDLKKKQMAEKGLPQNVKEKIWNSKAGKQAEIYDDYFEKQLKQGARDKIELSSKKSEAKPTNNRPASSDAPPQRSAREMPRQELPEPAKQNRNLAPPAAQNLAQKSAPASTSPPITARRYIDIMDDDVPVPNQAQNLGTKVDRNFITLEKDVQSLKTMIEELSVGVSTKDGDGLSYGMTNEMLNCFHDLIAGGVEKRFARDILRNISFDLTPEEQRNESIIQERAASFLIKEIKVSNLFEGVGAGAGSAKCTIISLVGPTGVGKTTTIAKIASLAIMEKRLRVGLINLDSYKIAAADQLSTYAKIMNLPFRSVANKEELQEAIFDFSSLDLILIDTTGRSQKDQDNLLDLKSLLGDIDGIENLLLLSATTKDSDLNEIVNRFKMFKPAGLVFSKLDETSMYGCIYNTQRRTSLPLFYFTVGQRVPEDIERASPERVVDLILDL